MNATAKRAAQLVLLVAVPSPVALGFLFWRWRQRKADVKTLTDTLRAGLPGVGQAYAPDIAAAAVATAPAELGPDAQERWAFLLAGVVSRESAFGVLLRPRGPNGLGDFGHGHGLGQVDDRFNAAEPDWSKKRLAHIASGDWTDPTKHLLFCARYLRHLWDRLSSVEDLGERLRAAAAAYNAGLPAVQAQFAQGNDPDAATTHRDYGADVLARAEKFASGAAEGEGEAVA